MAFSKPRGGNPKAKAGVYKPCRKCRGSGYIRVKGSMLRCSCAGSGYQPK